ncbi:MAG: 50S ribosomal protein L19e [Candidatus Kariarchaeaceae archaeon]
MVDVRIQRRIAASILGIGLNRVHISPDPDDLLNVSLAVTREDVRRLIHDGTITKKHVKGISRGRARARKPKQDRGQRRGPGRRKGKASARNNPKRAWINKIRSQRRYLKNLRDEGFIERSTYRTLYRQAKGNAFRSVRYLRTFITEHQMALRRLPELKR